jgi:RNA polymerase sigma factor for flagellar operon FliA
MDWVPRTLRRKQKDIEEANHVLSSQLGRAATEEELAQRLGVSLDELHKSLDDLKGMTLGSFEDVGGEGEGLIALIPDPDSEDPHLVLHEAEWREIIKKGIDELPEKECRIVQLYYYEELNMKQIGKILEITESRVSQLHTKAMLHLRRELRSRQIDRR